MIKILCILLSTIFLVSCGTLSGSKSIIIADSTPRGMKVFSEEKKELGITPFFFKAKTRWKTKFVFKSEENKIEIPFKYKCHINWASSLLPNGMLGLGAPAVAALFIGTDLFSGGIWNCVKPLHYVSNQKNINHDLLHVRKKRILILPVVSNDREISRKIINFYTKKIFNEFNKEDAEIIDNEETKDALFERGLDNYASTHPDKIKREFLNELGEQFNLTHFYYFDIKEEKNKIVIKPQLFDAFTLKPVKAKYSKTFRLKLNTHLGIGFLKKLISMIDFLPNSIIVSHPYTLTESREVALDPSQTQLEARANSHPDAFPKLVSLLLLDTAHHPRFYDSWDYSGFLSPKLGASSWKSAYTVTGIPYEFLFESYFVFYDAILGIFTPFGEFDLGIGLGLVNYIASDNQGFERNRVVAATHIGFSYTLFLSNRTYFKVSADQYIAPDNKKEPENFIKTDYYHLKSWKEIKVGLGYYFPEIKALTRKLLPF